MGQRSYIGAVLLFNFISIFYKEKREMQKPLTVAHQDFKDSMVCLINNSGLPAFILADTLSGFVRDLNALAKQQY
jgi:hypothetical protein